MNSLHLIKINKGYNIFRPYTLCSNAVQKLWTIKNVSEHQVSKSNFRLVKLDQKNLFPLTNHTE